MLLPCDDMAPEFPAPDPPQVSDLLRQLLSPLRTKWVGDFLFASEPIHLSPPGAPPVADAAVLRTISTLRTEPSHLRKHRPLAAPETSHLQGNLLYTPVITIDGITLGFGVMDAVSTPTTHASDPLRPPSNICTQFRCVRDGNLGTLLEVHDIPAEHSVVMRCLRVESTTITRSFKARFHRKPLLSSVRASQTDAYFADILHSLQSFEIELQHRTCPVCSARANTPCDCRYKVPPSAHIFDHAPFQAAMKYIVGVFEGVASKVRFRGGRLTDYTVLGSCTRVAGFRDDGATKSRLLAWAAAGQGGAAAPWAALPGLELGQLSPVGSSAEGVDDEGRHDGAADGELLLGSFADELLLDCTGGAARLADGFALEAVTFETLPGRSVRDVLLPETEAADAAPGADMLADAGPFAGGEEVADALGDADAAVSSASSVGGVGGWAAASTAASAAEDWQTRDEEEAAQPVGLGETAMTAKELKKEIRKRKNRESALRSNRRKRAIRDALASDLSDAQLRVVQLRDVETRLRKENMRLRKCFVQRG